MIKAWMDEAWEDLKDIQDYYFVLKVSTPILDTIE